MWTESKLILASGNKSKINEFERLFAGLGTEIINQATLGINPPEETGLTFVENALLKARYLSQKSHLPVLSDDSGLIIPALNGAPGLYSARYAGPEASDFANLTKLLREMRGLKGSRRRGYYVTAITLIRFPEDPDPLIAIGRWNGQILHGARGEGGFGYDPIFLPQGHYQTAAEMRANEKDKISHRGRAVKNLIASLT